MGWLTDIDLPHGSSVKSEIDKLLTWQPPDRSFDQRVLRSALVAMCEYYAAVERRFPDGRRSVWAAVFLVRIQSGPFGTSWGYKDMEESMGPYVHRCPLAILDLLTEPLNEHAADWRRHCRTYHGKRARITSLKPGMRIKLASPMRFTDGAEIDSFEIVRSHTGRGIGFMQAARRYAPSLRALNGADFTIIMPVVAGDGR